MSEHGERKADHLDLCATDQVAFQSKTTLFEDVQLIHNALPELHRDDVDLSTSLVGKTLQGPLVIAAMTGGLARADEVNRELAQVADDLGLAFGFGSMRPLLEEGVTAGYLVRDVAPNAVLFANLGIVQASQAKTDDIARMVERTGCDAICIHLNPAMEVIQPGGDRDFRGGIATLERLVKGLPVPVIAKETGCGLSRSVGQRIVETGVRTVDVSGAGGTSWVGVETLRARALSRRLGELYWDWGIPTAASVLQLEGLGLEVIATGGVNHGLDIAKALALGATAGGMARPLLKAWNEGGQAGAHAAAVEVLEEVRIACLLTGAAGPSALRSQPRLLGPALQAWAPGTGRS